MTDAPDLHRGRTARIETLRDAGVPAPELPRADDPAGAGPDSVCRWDVPAPR